MFIGRVNRGRVTDGETKLCNEPSCLCVKMKTVGIYNIVVAGPV